MEIKENIREFVVENFLFGDGDELENNTDFFEKSIIDSTGILELVCFVEESCNLTISDEEIVQENFSSVDRVSDFVQKRTSNSAQ